MNLEPKEIKKCQCHRPHQRMTLEDSEIGAGKASAAMKGDSKNGQGLRKVQVALKRIDPGKVAQVKNSREEVAQNIVTCLFEARCKFQTEFKLNCLLRKCLFDQLLFVDFAHVIFGKLAHDHDLGWN